MSNCIISGENIYFRSLERSDIDAGWHDWINNHAVYGNLQGVFPVHKEELEQYWESSVPPNAVMFAVCERKSGQYIGNARLSSIDWVNRSCAYGRMMGNRDFQGKGYGTEALILLLRFAFHRIGMNRVASGAVITNAASLRSNDKAGMVREAIHREAAWKDGKFHDVVWLSMIRSDFDRLYGTETS